MADEQQELELTTEEVREIVRMAQFPVSLEKPIGEKEDAKLADLVEDELAESPFDVTSISLLCEDIEHALSALPERARQVIVLRSGFGSRAGCEESARRSLPK